MIGQGFKLWERRFRLDVRKNFVPQRMVRHRHRLHREAVNASSLEPSKARLDWIMGSLIWWTAILPTAGELELDDL